MRKSRFSEEKMVDILREADRLPTVVVSKKHRVSEQTITRASALWQRGECGREALTSAGGRRTPD